MTSSSLSRACIAATLAMVAGLSTAGAQGGAASPPPPPSPAGKQIVGRPTATLSPAVRIGNLLFMSGTLPRGADTTIQGQTKSALDAMKVVLDQAGGKVEDVVKCTVFLINNADFRGMNEAYSAFFGTTPPARSTVIVAGLVSAGAKLEIECIAAMK
jgi:2-iminobutanoate/2-iminopropanoate deaminase